MTPIEDRVRSAIQATAHEVPPGSPPLLTLPERRRWFRRPSWWAWAIPVGAVVTVVAVVVTALSLITSPRTGFQPSSAPFPLRPASQPARSQSSAAGVPPYYVALTSPTGNAPGSGLAPNTTTATIRATATGQVLATIAVPRPYRAFTEVAAAADDRTFVLVAEGGLANDLPAAGTPGGTSSFPPARLYLLHLDPASRTAGGQAQLQALPASYIPAGSMTTEMALSADGTSLAAVIGSVTHSKLYVFHLRTGAQHAWNWADCQKCGASSSVSGSGLPYPRLFSWAADGRTLVLVAPGQEPSDSNEVRLLDTDEPGSNPLADSKLAPISLGGPTRLWLDATITPDGRTILAVREIIKEQAISQQLVTFSAATGQQTAAFHPQAVGATYLQIQWASASGGEVLVTGAQRTGGAGILKNGHYSPIPWSSKIFDAAW